jgi:hypothetical protein
MRRFLRDNALSVTMFGCFLVLWAAQSISGFHATNADNLQHHQPLETYPNYLTTGHFVEATAENWESEFLQMSGYIFLTAFLRQRGSPESKPFEGDETDEDPRDARDRHDVPWPVRRAGSSSTSMSTPSRWCCLASSWLASPSTPWVGRPSSTASSSPTAGRRCRCSSS